jgi:uncharacterized protein (UPF0332 family)
VTDDNKRRNLRDEIARATDALRAAEALVGLGLHADAVSRAYYGVFHLLRALLLSRGVEPKTHAGAIHLFNTELVRAGLFPSSHNRLLAGLQRARELADYDAAVVFSEQDARAELAEARELEKAALDHLRREGWIP